MSEMQKRLLLRYELTRRTSQCGSLRFGWCNREEFSKQAQCSPNFDSEYFPKLVAPTFLLSNLSTLRWINMWSGFSVIRPSVRRPSFKHISAKRHYVLQRPRANRLCKQKTLKQQFGCFTCQNSRMILALLPAIKHCSQNNSAGNIGVVY
jgi:hypothetical protein